MADPLQSILADRPQARIDAAILAIERRIRDILDRVDLDGELVAYNAQNIEALDKAAKSLGQQMQEAGVADILAEQRQALLDISDEI